ncbi:MAG: glutamate 5-kinase [Nitrospinota bacterium]|nr:glutamate 5-kinase [Nitrospinota bacterium]
MSIENRLGILKKVKRVIVKIGSGVLASSDGTGVNVETMRRLVRDICRLEENDRFQVIVVTSGAVMAGSRALGLSQEHLSIPVKQASSAVGQVALMNMYEKAFAEHGRRIGQILLTHDDISNRRRFLNARNAVSALLDLGVIPIINENDSAAVHEIKFGDNDTLSAMMTSVVDADLLLILSDVDGLYDSDPIKNSGAKKIDSVPVINDHIRNLAGESGTATGAGGMKAKVIAAEKASAYGVPTWIIGGKVEESIEKALFKGEGGTFFYPKEEKIANRKHWIGHVLKPKGTLTVDAGAREAIVNKGKSLLPSGVVGVDGKFESGESVIIKADGGKEIARGIVNYHAFEMRQIMGKKSSDIEETLGYKTFDEVVHRNDLVVLEETAAKRK